MWSYAPPNRSTQSAADVGGAMTIIKSFVTAFSTQADKSRFLRDPDCRIGGIAQHKAVEVWTAACITHGFTDRLQARHDPMRVLVVSTEEQRGARGQLRQRRAEIDVEHWVSSDQHRTKSDDRADKG